MASPFDHAWALLKAPIDYLGHSNIPHQEGDLAYDHLTGEEGKIVRPKYHRSRSEYDPRGRFFHRRKAPHQLEDKTHFGGERFSHELSNQENMDFRAYLDAKEQVAMNSGAWPFLSPNEWEGLVDEFNEYRGNETPQSSNEWKPHPDARRFLEHVEI